MRDITIETITPAVIGALTDIPPRNREILTAAIRHIHDFCREVNITFDEWLGAMGWLLRAGEISSATRNEFILITDILGVEVLVDMLDKRPTNGETVSTVLGPFYRENPPVLPKGASIIQKGFPDQQTVRLSGRVTDTDGNPVEGVTIDVWEDGPNGLYEQQDPDQPDMNLRGRFETDGNGEYELVCIRPVPYPIPYDGAAGELLNYMGHHPMRPSHIHFLLTKDGYKSLISQIYDSESEHLDSDSVFAVKEDLIGHFRPAPEGADTDLVMRFDFSIRNNALVSLAA